ncbi:MAG: AAA family ATPase [Oscillospiraceae bacterium]|nr:AAA family ATPase [Oscillospiraceae bacterium]
MPEGIIICGGNGSGKTTLGRELAAAIGYKHMDIEDYYFMEADIPYSRPRTRDEVIQLMLKDTEKYGHFIISAVNGDMGKEINSMYCCAVYLSAPKELRLERVKRRAIDKFGDRVLPGGDMYEQEQLFFKIVLSHTTEQTKQWLKMLSCPVIYADGTREISENVMRIRDFLNI